MEPMATSSLARARTSAEAESVVTRSTTVDLAAAAERTPIEPTMKYETFRVTAGLAVRYLEKSGVATGSRAAGGEECIERRKGEGAGAGAHACGADRTTRRRRQRLVPTGSV